MKLPLITNVKNLKGKRVLLRLSLNVPVHNRGITNDFRIERSLPTLRFLQKAGAKTLVISHSDYDEPKKPALLTVARHLNSFVPTGFLPLDGGLPARDFVQNMKEGSVFVLDNIRNLKGEVENTSSFAKELASYGDIFVNEDFAVSHRKHASIVGIPKYIPSFFGSLFAEEVTQLSRAFKPKHPFVAVLGGAKFSTKVPLVKRFLQTADRVFVSGALANTFFHELGYETGKSLVDNDSINLKPFLKNKKITLPSDVTVKGPKKTVVKSPVEVEKGENMLDVGPESVQEMSDAVSEAKLVVWNGPLGNFEKGFSKQTEKFARAVAASDAHSIVGGGDTIAAIQKLGIMDQFDFVSTGGGAMLEFLEQESLPGIEAILKSKK